MLLEAKIVEVDLDHAYQAGIDWVKVLQLGASHYFIGQGTPPNGFGTAAALTPSNSPVTIAPGNPINGFARRFVTPERLSRYFRDEPSRG